mgnify:CR=1 FL=1|jgi:uncharacterized membrane protein
MKIAIALHLLASLIWVGGMFFALIALRPATMALETKERIKLWTATLTGFFPWVWAAIITILVSGYWMIFMVFGGMKNLGLHIHLMQTIGILMMLLYMPLFFAPFRRLKIAVKQENYELAAKKLGQVRILVAINLVLGILNVIIGSAGRYL